MRNIQENLSRAFEIDFYIGWFYTTEFWIDFLRVLVLFEIYFWDHVQWFFDVQKFYSSFSREPRASNKIVSSAKKEQYFSHFYSPHYKKSQQITKVIKTFRKFKSTQNKHNYRRRFEKGSHFLSISLLPIFRCQKVYKLWHNARSKEKSLNRFLLRGKSDELNLNINELEKLQWNFPSKLFFDCEKVWRFLFWEARECLKNFTTFYLISERKDNSTRKLERNFPRSQ
jgi:hypothetical protein